MSSTDPEQDKNKNPKPVKLPTQKEIDHFLELDKKEKVENNRNIGREPFWDSTNQRTCAYIYCKRHGLDFRLKEVKIAVREMYRTKNKIKTADGGVPLRAFKEGKVPKPEYPYKRHRAMQATADRIFQDLDATSNRATTSKQAENARSERYVKNINSPRKNDDKPSMTRRIWNGEHYDPESQTWLPAEPDARKDYFAWYNEFLYPMMPNAIPLGKIHETWAEEMESDDRVMMFKPRDHYKTTFITIGYSVYSLCEFQFNRYPILIVSKSELNTRDTMASIRAHLESNERILSFYGYLINEDLKNDSEGFFTHYQDVGVKDPALYCATFGANIVMGTHPRMAMLDDIETKALTPALMYQAKTLLDKSLLSGLPPGSVLFLIGTIKGWDEKNDIYLYAKKKGIFSVYEDPAVYKIDPITKIPALDASGKRIWGMPDMKYVKWWKERVPVIDKDGKPVLTWKGNPKMQNVIRIDVLEGKDAEWMSIYPERYSVKDIIRKRIETREVDKENDDTFWSEFFLKPCKPGGNFFSTERVKMFPPRGHASSQAYFKWLDEYDIPTVIWIDPGGKKSHGISLACMCFWKGEFHVIDLSVIKKGMPEAAKKIALWRDKYNVQYVGCEGNFDQKETFGDAIEGELERYCIKNHLENLFIKIHSIPNKGDKILRIQTHMASMLGSENTSTESDFFVNPDAEDIEQFMSEMSSFPNLIPGAEHEWDLMDSVTSAKIHLAEMTAMLAEVDAF